MHSLCRQARPCPRIVHSRRVSSLLTVAPLEQRTLGFSKIARRVTKEPTWELVALLRRANDPTLRDVLQRCGISSDEWTRWSPVLYASTFERAVDLLRQAHADKAPSWVVLALASHKVKSPSDAQSALFDISLPLTSLPPHRPSVNMSHAFPLLILTTHSLAYFSLISLLRPLTAHLISLPPHAHTYPAFHFNMLLQAISLFDRSRVAADVAVEVLKEMQSRGLTIWPNTERVLIRDNFRSPQLLDYFRRRGPSPSVHPEKQEKSEAWLRAYASLCKVESSAHYLHSIRERCLENGFPPPYTAGESLAGNDGIEEPIPGSAHKANTHYLRSMRNDRQSAFRYFHHLLKLDLTKSGQSPPPLPFTSPPDVVHKSNVDIYDWTTALYAGAHDRTLSASSLLDLFKATKQGTNAYKPTRATYTVVIQGLLWRNAIDDAQKLWDDFVGEVVNARGKADEEKGMRIDRKALCVGIDVLVRSGRTEEALYLLDEAVKRDMEAAPLNGSSSTSATVMASSTSRATRISPYLKVHPIHVLLTALLRIHRPDAIFYIWTHLTSLYFVPPTNLMLRILLKAAIQASKMDGESLKGAMSWYIADKCLFKKQGGPIAPTMAPYKPTDHAENQDRGLGKKASPSDYDSHNTKQSSVEIANDGPTLPRETLVAHLHALFQPSASIPPSVVGIWASRRSTEVARSIFRGMIFGNWPALCAASKQFGNGVTSARAKGGEGVFQELARVFAGRPDRFLPAYPTHLGTARPTMALPDVGDAQMGPPLPTVIPSESTFASYIALLGLSSRADEIPEVLMWMRALEVVPKTETFAVALVFWMEVGLRGPVFEDGWTLARGARDRDDKGQTTVSGTERTKAPPRTEYGALRAWIREWVGEQRAPKEEDIYAGIRRVREMRDGQFGKRGGQAVLKDARQRDCPAACTSDDVDRFSM